jgi:hypothetical protein
VAARSTPARALTVLPRHVAGALAVLVLCTCAGTAATVTVTGGELAQSAGTTTSNAGTVNLAPGGLWLVQGGTFTNTGTLVPQIASSGSLGQFSVTVQGTFGAGGTLSPSLTSGDAPATGTEVPFVTLNGGRFSGTFGWVTGGFTPDDGAETTSPAFMGLVDRGAPSAGSATTGAPTPGTAATGS